MAACTPAHRAHLVAVDDSLGYQIVDAGHNIVIAESKIISRNFHSVLLAVVRRASIVRKKTRVARSGVDVRVVAIARVKVQQIGARWTAVNLDDQRISLALLVADGFHEYAFYHAAVARFPLHDVGFAKRDLLNLRIGVGQPFPSGAVRELLEGCGIDIRRRNGITVIDRDHSIVGVVSNVHRCLLARELRDLPVVERNRAELISRSNAGVEVNRLSILRPKAGGYIVVKVRAKFPPFAPRDRTNVQLLIAEVSGVVRGGERDHRAVRRKREGALVYVVIIGKPLDLPAADFEQVEVDIIGSFSDGSQVPVFRLALETDPLRVARKSDAAYAVPVARSQPRFFFGVQIKGPKLVHRRVLISDANAEFLFLALLVRFVEDVRRKEIYSPAIERELPRGHRSRVLCELNRSVGFNLINRDSPNLLLVVLARRESQPLAVAAERERADAVFCVGDPASFAAVGPHHVKLVLRRRGGRRFAI